MTTQIPEAGSINAELARETHQWWMEAAEHAGIDLTDFDPAAPLSDRIAWALRNNLSIGTVYTRYSTRLQSSTADQTKTNVEHAAAKCIYCPPEYVCIDEGQRGCKTRRDGLDRMLFILQKRLATVLLVFKASRLYRQAYRGYQLIQQEVVEEGLRAISVTQQIDTINTKQWRMMFQIHGIADEMLVEATSDHVRSGLRGLFARGYTVGAIPVGYRRREIPEAPLTNRGLPRTAPEIDPDVGPKIKEHFELIRDGLPIRQGWLRWVAEGLPTDPRSTSPRMTYVAYRKMLERDAYRGYWEFGRMRNQFSTKKDYTQKVEQPDEEVEMMQCEDLRLVDDELFYAVQEILDDLKQGPRGPRKAKDAQLWDLVTDVFYCAHCDKRFYVAGAGGKGMRCKNGDLCPYKSTVRREEAIKAICEKLQELIAQDGDLIERVILESQQLDAQGDQQLEQEIEASQRKLAALERKLSDYLDLTGQGSDEDREEMKARIRGVRAERNTARAELTRLQHALSHATKIITVSEIRDSLDHLSMLLRDGAAGVLGNDAVHEAVTAFRLLVGGRINVHVEKRASRERKNVRGTFTPQLLDSVADRSVSAATADHVPCEVSVWLRQPPRVDLLAERVHELIDIERLSHRDTAKRLRAEGHNVNSGNVWYSYRRWYEMQGLEPPKIPYNNGHKRDSA